MVIITILLIFLRIMCDIVLQIREKCKNTDGKINFSTVRRVKKSQKFLTLPPFSPIRAKSGNRKGTGTYSRGKTIRVRLPDGRAVPLADNLRAPPRLPIRIPRGVPPFRPPLRPSLKFRQPPLFISLRYLQEQFLPCGYSGSSKNPAQTSCEYSCAGGMAQ